MRINVPSTSQTLKLFTVETCEALKSMDQLERRQKLAGVLTAFFQGKIPDLSPAVAIAKAAGVDEELVQKVLMAMSGKGFTSPSDAGDVMNRATPVTAAVFYTGVVDPLLDFGFEDLFDLVDMRGSKQTSFDIVDVTNTITFAEIKSGERMKSYGITTGKSTVSKMIVGAAIGILDDWINYAMYWNLNQAAVEARSKYFDKQATDHYALVEAGYTAQAFATDDITTINTACATALTDLQGKGFTVTGNEVFELRAPVALKQRIERAFNLVFNSPVATTANNPTQLVFSLNRKYTTKFTTNNYYYVILPGRKMKRGIWSDLSAETDRDILLRGTDVAYMGEYNAAIGEIKQVRRCALS